MPLSPDLVEILRCPVCHGAVRDDETAVVCTQCGRAYPVRDGIPHMLVEEAEVPDPPPEEG